MRKALIVLAALAITVPAQAGQIGNFYTQWEKDPVTDAETLTALTTNAAQEAFIVRCLAGDENMVLVVESGAKVGDPVKLLLRIDQAEPTLLSGQVVFSREGHVGFQFGDAPIIRQIAGAKQAAARFTIGEVIKTAAFPLRESAKVVDAVRQACKDQ